MCDMGSYKMSAPSSKKLYKYHRKRLKNIYNRTSNDELIELIQLYNRNQEGETPND